MPIKPVKFRLVSHKLGSSSLKKIQQGLSSKLGYKVFRGKSPKPFRQNLVYGDCQDKLTQYKYFQKNDIPAPEFTTDPAVAKEWAQKSTVICRTLLRGSEGKGIVVVEPGENVKIPHAPAYTKYVPKKYEYRVHIYKDKVVAVLAKRKKKGFDGEVNTKVRNTANGYVFCSQDVVEPPGIRELALKASLVNKSDFSGVDIGYNEKKDFLFVIEVNSAPGIEGSNVDKYISAITE